MSVREQDYQVNLIFVILLFIFRLLIIETVSFFLDRLLEPLTSQHQDTYSLHSPLHVTH